MVSEGSEREDRRKLAGEDLRVWVRVEVMKFTGHCGFTAFSSKLSKQSLGKGSHGLGESLILCRVPLSPRPTKDSQQWYPGHQGR